MSWLDWLDANEFAYVAKRGGSRKAAVEAMQRPEYADEFARIGARLDTAPDGELYEVVPFREIEATFARLVIAALLEGDDARPGGTAAQRREPLPVPQTTVVVRARIVDRASWPAIESEVRLSHRKVNYIREAIEHDDLGWDLDRDCLTLGPETQNTPAGLVLPAR